MNKEINRRLYNIKAIENGQEVDYPITYFEAKDLTIEDFLKQHPCKIHAIEFYYGIGTSVLDDYEDMCAVAKQYPDILFYFDANGVTVYADAESDPKLAEKYFIDCVNLDVHELGPGELVLDDDYISFKEYENELKAKIWDIEKDLHFAKEKLQRFQASFAKFNTNS